ncbi:MAG: cyclic nucleotide-binding domain-containing protein [bacterium]|nr:cyclic nucleotide-binding domain-containing protein [bacterium]
MKEVVIPAQREDPEWHSLVRRRRERHAVLLEMLGELPLFNMLSWKELEKLARIVHRRHFIPGESVLRPRVPRSGMFVIQSGSVHVVRTLEDGSPVVVGRLGAGELLGEFSLLDDSPRSTAIVAAETSELVGFFRPDLMDLIETDPKLGFKILYRLSQIMAAQLREDLGRLRRVRKLLLGGV